MAQWLKVEPKHSTLFLSIDISFLIIEEVHAMDTLDGEAKLAWQTWESKSFFKDMFFLETKSKSFEIEAILFILFYNKIKFWRYNFIFLQSFITIILFF